METRIDRDISTTDMVTRLDTHLLELQIERT